MKAYEDPRDPGNGWKYRTGKPCIERGCDNPAGTAWSHLWCMPCNVKRMNRVSASLEGMQREMAQRASAPSSDDGLVQTASEPKENGNG